MKYIHTKGLDLSRFMLGTVQLGMEYGLGSDRAKPSSEKAFAMLDQAAALGVQLQNAVHEGVAIHFLGAEAGLDGFGVLLDTSDIDHLIHLIVV